MFDFPEDELEPHPGYDFFTPGPLPGYADNPNNNNGWLEEVAEPVAEAEEEQMIALVVDIEDEQMAALVMDMEEDLAALFGEDDDFEDDDFMPAVQPSSVYEVGGPSTAAAEGPSFPLPAPGLPIPPLVIEDLSTHLGNLEYEHGQLVKKVIRVQVMASQMVHAADRWEQVGAQVEQGRGVAERRSDSAATDYGLEDEQP
nr:hypothetical protein [Tanacetum cinerariifolium]